MYLNASSGSKLGRPGLDASERHSVSGGLPGFGRLGNFDMAIVWGGGNSAEDRCSGERSV